MSKEKKDPFLEDVEKKAEALTAKLKNKVTPIIVTHEGEKIVGYIQELSYDVLMYAVDMYVDKQLSKASEAALADGLIREESDPRILSTERKDARIKAGFTNACLKFVAPLADEYKKK